MNLKFLILPFLIIQLSGCAGLTLDDIFNPKINNTPEEIEHQNIEVEKEKIATTLPNRSEQAVAVVQSKHQAFAAVGCLEDQLINTFKLPENFYGIKYYPDGSGTVRLINPYSEKKGLYFDIAPQENGSEIRLYPNYSTISEAWKKIPAACR